jgi:hypothetical protein
MSMKTSKTAVAVALGGAALAVCGAVALLCGSAPAGYLLIALGCFWASMAQVV